MSTSSTGMPSLSATTCAKVVSWPWPWLWRAGEDRHLAGRVHAHLAAFEQAGARAQRAGDVARRDAAGLDVAL
jgi:hypothetical protein